MEHKCKKTDLKTVEKCELNREKIIKALQDCIDRPKCIDCPNLTLCSGHGVEYLLVQALSLIKELTEEISKREYIIVGVMHSVDKWLDGAELEQDEVNRAATMREKTLHIVEKLTEEVESLKQCLEHEHASFMETFGELDDKCKRLTEENKAWQAQLVSQKEKADKAYYDLACEVENLRAENERLRTSYETVAKLWAKSKADTVRKYREGLHKELASLGSKDKFNKGVFLTKADQIAKEMIGEKND